MFVDRITGKKSKLLVHQTEFSFLVGAFSNQSNYQIKSGTIMPGCFNAAQQKQEQIVHLLITGFPITDANSEIWFLKAIVWKF